MQERPLVVSIPVEGVFSCRHSIYEAAQEMVMAVQGSARVGDAGLQRRILFRGILPYDDEEVEEDSRALARW
ncbi:hypothetical protein NUU61_000644 [Penicillium alfredii]|uniref:Uncharacterized protein n=1 Tax=Penicillium alfredii TaxID=1506179 RepID=A0A9W9KQW0_9EURO|nr:uncharacterized protein NUU61_000644 [Penicillium alfredii]KAJ5114885.1 hypothetical protein NUU61_000644 [Penicillium alfredii]